jgi:hypothetical protein
VCECNYEQCDCNEECEYDEDYEDDGEDHDIDYDDDTGTGSSSQSDSSGDEPDGDDDDNYNAPLERTHNHAIDHSLPPGHRYYRPPGSHPESWRQGNPSHRTRSMDNYGKQR